jgi:hypothetical protein
LSALHLNEKVKIYTFLVKKAVKQDVQKTSNTHRTTINIPLFTDEEERLREVK